MGNETLFWGFIDDLKILSDDISALVEFGGCRWGEPTPIPGVKEIIHPYEGKIINLHDTPVYRNATDEMYFRCISGRFYFYDSTIVNGRAKITATQHMPKKNPSYILGYININE